MKSYTNNNPLFSETISIYEYTDYAAADQVLNIPLKSIMDNTLKLRMDDATKEVTYPDEYDSSLTYNVGQLCMHEGLSYKCITQISTAENWDPLKWEFISLGNAINGLENRVSTNEDNISSLNTRTTTAEGNISALGTRMTTAEGNIFSLSSRVGTAENNISAQNTRLGTAEGNISSLSSGLNTTNSNVSSLSSRLNTTNTNVSSLEGMIKSGKTPYIGTGVGVNVNDSTAVAVGNSSSTSSGTGGIAIGYDSDANSNYGIAIGYDGSVRSSSNYSIAIGYSSSLYNSSYNISIGYDISLSGCNYSIFMNSTSSSRSIYSLSYPTISLLAGNNLSINEKAISGSIAILNNTSASGNSAPSFSDGNIYIANHSDIRKSSDDSDINICNDSDIYSYDYNIVIGNELDVGDSSNYIEGSIVIGNYSNIKDSEDSLSILFGDSSNYLDSLRESIVIGSQIGYTSSSRPSVSNSIVLGCHIFDDSSYHSLSDNMIIKVGYTNYSQSASSGDMIFAYNNNNQFVIHSNGNANLRGTLSTGSDKRLKDILDLEIPDVSNIKAVVFKWNDNKEYHDEINHIGYLAQDVEEVLPELVTEESNGYKNLNYTEFLIAKIDNLERKIAELENKLNNL